MNPKEPRFWGLIGAVVGLLGALADTSNLLIDVLINAGFSFAIWYFVALAIITMLRNRKS